MTYAGSDVDPAILGALRSRLRGTTLTPSDEDYEGARRVWNAAIDRRPSMIITCADAEDVSLAVRIAADHGLSLTIRGGGHNVAGRSIRDGVALLDLSRLRHVAVNRESRVAIVQGGARWCDVDQATAVEGLATTGGLISTTGVGGFTLGGGAGWLMRKHGLACDNLRRAGVMLADGRFVFASVEEHPDLYWGLRGGAGGLGVVTSFEMQLHPLREVLAGLVVHSAEHGLEALRAFRDFASNAADEFCGIAVIGNAPPLPFLAPAWHGRPVVIFAVCWSGILSAGESALAPLRGHGRPIADHIVSTPYFQWQKMRDSDAPAGRRYHWKTGNFAAMEDATLERLAAAAEDLPTPQTTIHLQHMGAAVARVPVDDTAFAHRQTPFFVNIFGVTDQESKVARMCDRVRTLHAKLAEHALHGTLTNFSDRGDADEVTRFGDRNAERLESLRRHYDPTGMFQDL